jgi:gluconate 2-dehydrogenase gamma chain
MSTRIIRQTTSNKVQHTFTNNHFKRRSFLLGSASLSLFTLACQGHEFESQAFLSLKEPFRTLHILQYHLWPDSKEAPTLKNLGALGYLKVLFENDDFTPSTAHYLKKGVVWIDEESHDIYKKPFFQLSFKQRETLLERINQTPWGEGVLYSLLVVTLETLMSDPIYGGNKDQLGWEFLNHTAGFPRPTKPLWEQRK